MSFARQLLEMAVPSEKVKARTYYHGTDSEETARKIIADKCLKAPQVADLDARYGKAGFQRPVAGRVYLTPSLRYAVIYALGGSYAGHELPERYFKGSQFGYVFVAPGSSLEDIEPDEDQLGGIQSSAQRAAKEEHPSEYDDHPDIHRNLRASPGTADWLSREAGRLLTPNMSKRALDGVMSWQSKAGKRLMKHMDPSMRVQVADLGTSIAAKQACVPWTQVWRLDKRRSQELKRDGSNFFEIAEQVA